jgi:cysteine-rich repeat protein
MCTLPVCGDSFVQPGAGETCDDGNLSNSDACLATCKIAACHDTFLHVGVEQCDDGNMIDTDACVLECLDAKCGDGLVHAGVEQCDDGNTVATDACTDSCKPATCGDGIVWAGQEQCDDANANDNDACTNACTVGLCANGTQNAGELGVDCGGPCPKQCLVINEVDYDQPGTDNAEFVEIFNVSSGPVSLAGHWLVPVNGNGNAPYSAVDLGASFPSLAAGQYLVVIWGNVTVPAGQLKLVANMMSVILQNGSPDGVALVHVPSKQYIDALSYAGEINGVTFMGVGPFNLVEGTPAVLVDSATNPGSLSRIPNGIDTNQMSVDWKFVNTPTPGAANVP